MKFQLLVEIKILKMKLFSCLTYTDVVFILLIIVKMTIIVGILTVEPVHEISNNMVCATSKASDQHAHARSLIRAFASRLSIL